MYFLFIRTNFKIDMHACIMYMAYQFIYRKINFYFQKIEKYLMRIRKVNTYFNREKKSKDIQIEPLRLCESCFYKSSLKI